MIDGPRLPPAAGGAPRQLIVFLHGYGADGNDLIGLGREWAKLLPHAAFVSPHAPEACGMAPMGRQWFNLTFRDAGEMVRGVTQALARARCLSRRRAQAAQLCRHARSRWSASARAP